MKVDITGASWRKSTRSGGANDCVEVADNLRSVVGVRDSKDPHGPALVFTDDAWDAFVGQVKHGSFNRR